MGCAGVNSVTSCRWLTQAARKRSNFRREPPAQRAPLTTVGEEAGDEPPGHVRSSRLKSWKRNVLRSLIESQPFTQFVGPVGLGPENV